MIKPGSYYKNLLNNEVVATVGEKLVECPNCGGDLRDVLLNKGIKAYHCNGCKATIAKQD